jgi:hypothetical protein
MPVGLVDKITDEHRMVNMTHENFGRSYARKENFGISLAYHSLEEDRLHSAMVM